MKNKMLLIFFFFFVMPISFTPRDTVFIDGIYIQGYDVSGLNRLEAEEKIKPYIRQILSQEIVIVSPDKKKIWLTSYERMGITIDLEKALAAGLAPGNKGFILKRWWERLKIKKDGYNIPLEIQIREETAAQEILKYTGDLVKAPQDAKLKVTAQNKVLIEPDISGVDIDIPAMLAQLRACVKLQGPISITCQTKEVRAKTTLDDIKKLKVETILGQFTTWFNPRQINRTQNIKMAAQALDNFLLAPQEEFSFNKIVGPRTKEAGYNDAPIILNNKFMEGIGGGVCQVSSTLYNVLLRANLPVTERYPHSLPVRYVPKGMDAAVVYGVKDLKFVNNTNGHILFKTYVGQGSLTIKLFGSKKDNHKVEVVSFVEKTFMPQTIIKNKKDLPIGQVIVEQNGTEGYIVRVERIIKDSEEKILIHEILSRDYYPPVDKVILTATN